MVEQLLTAIHVMVCLALIFFILIQRGKGAEMSAAMGAGASQTVFGSQGSHDFLGKMTKYLAMAFFVICLTLSYLSNQQLRSERQWLEVKPSVPQDQAQRAVEAIPD